MPLKLISHTEVAAWEFFFWGNVEKKYVCFLSSSPILDSKSIFRNASSFLQTFKCGKFSAHAKRRRRRRKGEKERFGLESPLYCLWEKKKMDHGAFSWVWERKEEIEDHSWTDGERKRKRKLKKRFRHHPVMTMPPPARMDGIFFFWKRYIGGILCGKQASDMWRGLLPIGKWCFLSNREKLVFISRGEKKKRENWRNNHGKRELSSLQGRPRSTSYPLSDGGVTRPNFHLFVSGA